MHVTIRVVFPKEETLDMDILLLQSACPDG